MEYIYKSTTLSIAWRPCPDPAAPVILSFTGIQHRLGGLGATEFAHSLSACGIEAEALFLSDLSLSWYNSPLEEVLDFVEGRYAGRRLITLGNSMGGFAALLFSRLLPDCVQAVSFCPQYALSAARMPHEDRWLARQRAVQHWRHETCLPELGSRRARQFVFFGADEPRDRPHVERIARALNPHSALYLVQGAGHNLAPVLKEQGKLIPLLGRLLARDASPATVSAALADLGLAYSKSG